MVKNMKCQNCGKHEATIKWVGEGGILEMTHGMYQMWCKCCVLKAQLLHAEYMAGQIPKFKKALKKVKCS